MLPTIDLQFSDIVTFSMEINSPVKLPPAETTLKAEFADLLQLKFDMASEEGLPIGQKLPLGGSQLPPGPELSIPATPIDVATGTDVELVLAQTQIDTVAVVTPALSAAASHVPSQGQLAPVETAAAAALSIPENTPVGHKSAFVASPPLVLPAKTATEPRIDLHSATESLPNPVRKQVEPAAVVTPRDSGSQAQAPTAVLPVVTNSSPISRQERDTDVARENAKPLVARIEPGPRENNAVFEQRYPTRTSLPDTTPVGLAPPAVVPRSRSVSIPEQKSPSQMKLTPAATQAGNLLSQSGPVQFTHSPIQSIVEPNVSPSPSLTPSSTSQTIAMPVQMEAWGEKISERVLLMAGSQLKSANIRLTPAELGPLHVKVSMDDGAASVAFNAQHATTREALEMALPRLRGMLAENGITLGQTSVGDQGVSQGKRDGQTDAPTDTRQATTETEENTLANASRQQRGSSVRNGLVDTFA